MPRVAPGELGCLPGDLVLRETSSDPKVLECRPDRRSVGTPSQERHGGQIPSLLGTSVDQPHDLAG
ncbi:MAG TPA: hypothetical protein VJM46_00935 [Candidatus Saccharimonadales bacterium]|nr:hypothetical protein [Candidatus Saccharimonadales bacterium]